MHRWLLVCVMLLGALIFSTGMDWGLPTRAYDKYLFGGQEPWDAETISSSSGAEDRSPTTQASNIDVDAVGPAEELPWAGLTDTEADRAEILLRYRLYSHQPDEMTVFQALSSMDPSARDFDPKMYQYGGLFLYPIAGLLWLGAKLNLLTLSTQVGHFIDRPQDIGIYYLVARGYVALFGLLGILAAYKLGGALRNRTAGLVAALLFVLMPITVSMSHEAKPHLPGAVLAMWAAYVGIRYLQKPGGGRFAGLSALCGLAVGMVPAAGYILLLIPVAAWSAPRSAGRVVGRLAGGALLAVLVYLACNPYVAINTVQNAELLRSNFLNTSGMYAIGDPLNGARNALRLTLEGAGPLLAVAALLPLLSLGHRRTSPRLLMLGVPALAVLMVMVAVGANQPGEFGRFGVYLCMVLMLAVAAEIGRVMRRSAWAGALAVLVFVGGTGFYGLRYLQQYRLDAADGGTRAAAAAWLAATMAETPDAAVGVMAKPAPYAVPPLDFATLQVSYASPSRGALGRMTLAGLPDGPEWLVCHADAPPAEGVRDGDYTLKKVFRAPPDWAGSHNTIISWANKPICIWQRDAESD